MDVGSKQLRAPFSMIVSGQSGSGKTTFVHKLLLEINNVCDIEFKRIIYAYSVHQKVFDEISKIKNVILVNGPPDHLIDVDNTIPTLIIMDDLMLEVNDTVTAELFTKLRHASYSTIFITQNFFHNSKHWRTITRNAHYIILFRNPRDMLTVHCLGRQMYPSSPKFLPDALMQATAEPYSCLLIDLKPYTPERMRIRSGMFPDERKYCFVVDK